ncbi:hypothetical protein AAHC03_05675 [Spirometra sp. Aus1]
MAKLLSFCPWLLILFIITNAQPSTKLLTEKLPIFQVRGQAGGVLCPSFCECSKEVPDHRSIDRQKHRSTTSSGLYVAECHLAAGNLPIECNQNWNSLKLNLYNHSSGSLSSWIDSGSSPHMSHLVSCHELSSLYVTQTGDNAVSLSFQALLYGLTNLRRVWFHRIELDFDLDGPSNLLYIAPKTELIAFSDAPLNLDVRKPLFLDTPASLRQLRLSNVSLAGVFSKHLLVNLCHTLGGAPRTNDLVTLYLDRNAINSLQSDSLVGCEHLRVLQLSFNKLSGSLESVLGMRDPERQDVWSHRQTRLRAPQMLKTMGQSVLANIPRLQTLDLSGNFISSINSPLWAFYMHEDRLQSLEVLQSLSLSNNNLTFLARGAFQGAASLKEIDLSRNPHLFSPVEVPNQDFHSFIDPTIFGGLKLLKKLYWDFSSKTCLLSALSVTTDYGELSTGLFELFSRAVLCSTGEPTDTVPSPTPQVRSSLTIDSARQPPNRWRIPPEVEKIPLSKPGGDGSQLGVEESWAPIDIASSFLCALIGVLLVVLVVVLVVRSRSSNRRQRACCPNSRNSNKPPSASAHSLSAEPAIPCPPSPSILRGGSEQQNTLRHHHHHASSLWALNSPSSSLRPRITLSDCSDRTSSVRINHDRSLLLASPEQAPPPHQLNNNTVTTGLPASTLLRSFSVQNLCLACLEQVQQGGSGAGDGNPDNPTLGRNFGLLKEQGHGASCRTSDFWQVGWKCHDASDAFESTDAEEGEARQWLGTTSDGWAGEGGTGRHVLVRQKSAKDAVCCGDLRAGENFEDTEGTRVLLDEESRAVPYTGCSRKHYVRRSTTGLFATPVWRLARV